MELLTLSEVTSVTGEAGSFEVRLRIHPRYVDTSKCIACGLCAEKCPKKVDDEYDQGLKKRKAIYLKYAQAVPLKYAIDPEHCIYLQKGKCGACAKVCPNQAIDFTDTVRERTLQVGAVILATGSEAFDPGAVDTYGYLNSPNIVTNMEFERLLSSSGPTGGHLLRPSDGREPKKIAWLQCVGSRDLHKGAQGYCSSVCCTAAVKEAMLAKGHSKGFLDTAIFYIDIRTNGKNFERYFNRARDEAGVRFVKSKISTVGVLDQNGCHAVRYVDDTGAIVEESFDMVVLSAGLAVSGRGLALTEALGVRLNSYRFVDTGSFSPVETSRPGIYVCGAVQAPKDIPTSVIDSSAAAGLAGKLLGPARWTLTKTRPVPMELDTSKDPVRIGVFLCCCGTNIAGVVRMQELEVFARSLPGVVHVEVNLFSCSQDTQEKITAVIREQGLNRVVVAACTPKTHEALFQETLIKAGINKYLFEMANIRNQCSWVHREMPEAATNKSKDLLRMAVAKVALSVPLRDPELEVGKAVLVVGGGVAGMEAGRSLSAQGFPVHIVERTSHLGGNAWFIQRTWRGEDVQAYLQGLIDAVRSDPLILIHMESEVVEAEGFVGNFRSTVRGCQGDEVVVEHGVTIVASGASELKPDLMGYGRSPRVLTRLELQRKFIDVPEELARLRSVVLVQCVGSRIPERPYCSKLCCTQTIKSAMKMRELNPDMNIFVLYRDMRPYAFQEDLYQKARTAGIRFIRYCYDKGLTVEVDNEGLEVGFSDCVLRRKMSIRPEMLVLATAIVAEKDNRLTRLYKISQDEDGFFAEAHVKLRPVDFATEGVFVCGMAHGPKPIDESIAQAQAAAARAVTLLARDRISVPGAVAIVDPRYCVACGVCVIVCPYSAPAWNETTGRASIQPTLCKGCGLCVASCRSGAIRLQGSETVQIMSMIEAMVGWPEDVRPGFLGRS
ncbi:MAG: CoB--CoM heterodisulfide reductase iron-sulfur subunit A family protein [Deltaproteobacteria bacterium]|nr:CoB--CoM heterodisulfide reductase iron-sulfur subunit A family protein [Deltaproteobacteria bacterium]